MRIRHTAWLLAACVLFASGARAGDYRLLNDSEIMALMNGAKLSLVNVEGGSETLEHYFLPVAKPAEHGKTDVVMPHAWDVERGMWWVEEEQFCVLYQRIVSVRKRCFAVARADGDDIRFIETRYELPGKKVVRPHKWVESARYTRAPDPNANYHLLTDDELVKLISGAHIRLKAHDSYREVMYYFGPVSKPGEHGTVGTGRGDSGGTWWVEDEQYCTFFQNVIGARKRCFAIARAGKDLRFIETRWEEPGKVIDRPHEWVPSAQIFRSDG